MFDEKIGCFFFVLLVVVAAAGISIYERNKPAVVVQTAAIVEAEQEQKPQIIHQFTLLPLFPLFIVGGFAFYVLAVVWFVILIGLYLNERSVSAIFTFLGFFVLMYVFGNLDLYTFIKDNIIYIPSIIAGWLLIGLCWAFFRWVLYNKEQTNKFVALRKNWLKANPTRTKEEFIEHFQNPENRYRCARYSYGEVNYRPQWTDYKYQFFNWVEFWPIDFFFWVCEDFLRNLWNALYNLVSNFFQKVSDKIWDSVE